MTAPRLITPAFDAIPAVLGERRQWVLWRPVHKDGAKKPTKVPYPFEAPPPPPPTPRRCTLDEVRAAYGAGGFDGVGFVFTADDPFVGIDLDGCRDPVITRNCGDGTDLPTYFFLESLET